MYGVPADLNLEFFIGATLTQVALGEFQVQFHFTPEAGIAVEGQWELRDRSGHVVDHAHANVDRDAYRLHQLLGHQMTRVHIDAPESITLEFDNGHRLQIFDSSQEYESFTIQPGDIVI